MKSLGRILSFILVFSGGIFLLHLLVTVVFQKDPGFLKHSGVGHVTFYVLFVLLVLAFQKFVVREPFYSLGFERYPGWPVTIVKGWIVGVVGFIGYTLLMDSVGVIELRMKYGIGRVLLALVIGLTGFTIAATEELLFRGFFLQTLMKDLPRWIAVVITGIIFVLFHKLGAVQDFWTVPYDAMLAGGIFSLHILLCVAFFKSKTLYLPLGIHSGLVFTKVVFRKLKLIEVVDAESYLFGLGGDARRGVLAWGLFLAGILVLRYLITDREKKGLAHKMLPSASS
jgi:membrane protease YdiL (CAAX protease family)